MDEIFCGDARHMDQIPDESVNLIFTSPPYNVGMEYDGFDDKQPYRIYLKMLRAVWRECKKKLVWGGRIGINVANLGRTPYINLAAIVSLQLQSLGYFLMGDIIWNKSIPLTKKQSGFPVNGSTAWGSWCSPKGQKTRDGHEYIIMAAKGSPNLGRRGESDLTKKEFMLGTLGEWYLPPEANRKRNEFHPAPFPESLARRVIKLNTYVEDVVLDPFVGTGTTAIVAKLLGRHYLGIDQSHKYVDYARQRCSQMVLPIKIKTDIEQQILDAYFLGEGVI